MAPGPMALWPYGPMALALRPYGPIFLFQQLWEIALFRACKLYIRTLYNVCSVHRGMFSTSGGVQYIGGYHEYIRGCSVHRGDIMMNVGGYHEYIGACSDIGGIP